MGLALPHQLWTGQEFLRSPAATLYWWTLWVAELARWWCGGGAAVVAQLTSRSAGQWGGPRVLRCRLGVPERARLDRLPSGPGSSSTSGSSDGPGMTRANPFSLLGAQRPYLRITAKALGEGSARLAHLRPGTRVLFEGPYGRLSSRARAQRKVVLAGAGVGITPLRALAEGLDYAPGEAIILQRYTAEPLFIAGAGELAAEKGLEVVYLPGHGVRAMRFWAGGSWPAGVDRAEALDSRPGRPRCVPLRSHCLDERCRSLALAAGVPSERIHTESFGW